MIMEYTDMKELVVIDDDPINNFICKKMIEEISCDFKIRSFESAEEGLAYLSSLDESSNEYPTHIMLDLNMPQYNGWQFLSDYQKLNLHQTHQASLYVVSSTILRDEIEKVKQLSFVTDFISKPLTVYKLKQLVETEGLP
jgi:CheY-like chemotaxis protein